MNDRKWMVVDERYSNSGVLMDMDCEIFDSHIASMERAQELWEQLSARDQQNRHVYNAVIRIDDLAEDAVDEDGNIDWNQWKSFGYPAYYRFDSAKGRV